jgi:hypothetical protein
LVCDGEETLHPDVVINTQTYTTQDYIEGVGDKWHITCEGYLTIKDNVAYIDNKIKKEEINPIREKIQKAEQSGFLDKSDLYERLKQIASMDIQLLESRRVFYEETTEHKFQINGEEHTFRFFDSENEQLYWFDDVEYYNTEDEVMDNLTIQDLLDWI